MSVSAMPVGLSVPGVGVGPNQNSRDHRGVIVFLVDGEVSQPALETARSIAAGENAELVVLNAVSLPEQTPLSLATRAGTDHAKAIARVTETVVETSSALPVSGSVRVGHALASIVVNAIETHGSRIVVMDESWHDSRLYPVRRTPLEKIVTSIDSSVVVPTGGSFPESPASLLVPVADGPHSGRAVEIAHSIASTYDSWIELLHVVPPGDHEGRAEAEKLLSRTADRLGDYENVDTWVLEAESVAEAIIDQSQYYDATVIGAPRTPRLRRFVFGSTGETIRKHASNCVVTVWR